MIERFGQYQFRYCHDVGSPGKVRIYIESQPSYGSQATDSHSTHRLQSGGGAPPHICIKSEHKPSSLAEAQRLARDWAASTENYRRGRGFHK